MNTHFLTRQSFKTVEARVVSEVPGLVTLKINGNNGSIRSLSVQKGQRQGEAFTLREEATLFQAEVFTILQVVIREEIKKWLRVGNLYLLK